MDPKPKELLEKSPLGIVICDRYQRITYCNQRFLTDTGLEKARVLDNLYPSLPIEAIDQEGNLVQLFNGDDKADIKFQCWQAPVDAAPDCRIHYFCLQREKRGKINLAAAKLEGSKLPKRASWVEFLDYEVSRSRRYNNPLSLLKLHLLVLDKPDNVADETLHQTIKDTLTDELRWADMIGHTDQGSYLMVLPETPADALTALQAKIEKALGGQLAFISQQIDYRVVFGAASWRRHDDAIKMLKRARTELIERLEQELKAHL